MCPLSVHSSTSAAAKRLLSIGETATPPPPIGAYTRSLQRPTAIKFRLEKLTNKILRGRVSSKRVPVFQKHQMMQGILISDCNDALYGTGAKRISIRYKTTQRLLTHINKSSIFNLFGQKEMKKKHTKSFTSIHMTYR
jgi:hypothetical protein